MVCFFALPPLPPPTASFFPPSSVNIVYIDRDGTRIPVAGKIGDNVLYVVLFDVALGLGICVSLFGTDSVSQRLYERNRIKRLHNQSHHVRACLLQPLLATL